MGSAVRSALLATVAVGCSGPRAPAPAPAREETIAASDGVLLRYDVRGTGSPALVFVHGWACDHEYWREQLDVFARDHLVVAVDLPGHGRSGRDRDRWSVESFGADVARVVEAERLDRVVLVGHSMGGPVCLEAAARLPGRVVGVIAVEALHDVAAPPPRKAAEALLARYDDDFQATWNAGADFLFGPDADPALSAWFGRKGREVDPDVAVAVARATFSYDAADGLRRAGVPVRCVNAAPRGRFARPTNVRGNRRFGDFDAVLMEGVGHFPMLERPGEFNDRLRALLDELAPEEGS